jgi:hypothetical protein
LIIATILTCQVLVEDLEQRLSALREAIERSTISRISEYIPGDGGVMILGVDFDARLTVELSNGRVIEICFVPVRIEQLLERTIGLTD